MRVGGFITQKNQFALPEGEEEGEKGKRQSVKDERIRTLIESANNAAGQQNVQNSSNTFQTFNTYVNNSSRDVALL